MRIEEAAAILGISVDAPIDIVKQSYKALALKYHPDKCSLPHAKDKFQAVSQAYTKLVAAHSNGAKMPEMNINHEDSHEMAAFMRMFMDLVGIFNEDGISVEAKLPKGTAVSNIS